MKLNITLEEWREHLNKPKTKLSTSLSLTEVIYKHNLLTYKQRRKARREMRNLRKQLAKFNNENGE